MIRRTFGSVPSFIPVALLMYGWERLGRPAHSDGLYAILALGMIGAILMPGVVVSVEALPHLLVPSRIRIWWRYERPRPAIPAYLRRAVLAADRHRCCWCGRNEDLQIDHIKPWSLGGLSSLWNMAVLCGPCNRVKSNAWRTRGGYVYYRPWKNAGNQELALRILRYEKWHRWRPARWLRAGWSLAA